MTGKTAILRALNWVVNNRPTGFRFKRYEADKPTSVTVETMEGYRVTLRKTAKNSTYLVKDPEGNIERFSKFNKEVPDLVKEVLNISEINLQKQLDAPFLVTSSGGEIAKTINRITKADEADKWITQLARDIRDARRDATNTDSDIEETEEELSELEGIDRVKAAFEKAKRVKKDAERASGRWLRLEKLKRELEEAVAKLEPLDNLDRITYIYKKVNETLAAISKHKKAMQNADALKGLNSDLTGIVSTLGVVDPQKAEIGRLIRQIDRKKDLVQTIESYLMEESAIQIVEQDLGFLVEDYTTLMKKHKICPTCFRKVGAADINLITEGIVK